jgi:hypothetical protein
LKVVAIFRMSRMSQTLIVRVRRIAEIAGMVEIARTEADAEGVRVADGVDAAVAGGGMAGVTAAATEPIGTDAGSQLMLIYVDANQAQRSRTSWPLLFCECLTIPGPRRKDDRFQPFFSHALRHGKTDPPE